MTKSLTEMTIGFIGAGQMASALGSGFVGNGLVQPAQILATDPSGPALAKFLELTGGTGVDGDRRRLHRQSYTRRGGPGGRRVAVAE